MAAQRLHMRVWNVMPGESEWPRGRNLLLRKPTTRPSTTGCSEYRRNKKEREKLGSFRMGTRPFGFEIRSTSGKSPHYGP